MSIKTTLMTFLLTIPSVIIHAENNDDPTRDLIPVIDPLSPNGRSLRDDTMTHLERLSSDRIRAATKDMSTRLANIHWVARGMMAAGVCVGVSAVWGVSRSKTKPNASASDLSEKDDKELQKIANIELIEANRYKRDWKRVPRNILTVSAVLGAISFMGVAFKPLADVISETTSDAIRLWWYGFEQWFAHEVTIFETELRELRKTLHQARRVQGSITGQPGMRLNREDVPATYYRDEIIVLFQRNIARTERIIALMYLIAPKRHHEKISENVGRIANIIHKLADHLEKDLNENTRDFLTHYSDKTLEHFHLLHGNIRPFISNFTEFWRR